MSPDHVYNAAAVGILGAVFGLLIAPACLRYREAYQLRRRIAEEMARRRVEARDLAIYRRTFPAFRQANDPGDQIP